MSQYALQALERLKIGLRKLPGVGPKSADRMAFHILKASKEEIFELSQALTTLKEDVRQCAVCFNLAEAELCPICQDPKRDRSTVFVVEQPKDLIMLEKSGSVRGVYHVLLGRISALEGVGPEDLTILALVERIKKGDIREVVMALNPTLEGDGTALYISKLLSNMNIKITRLARGVASGSHLEQASRSMIQDAVDGRQSY